MAKQAIIRMNPEETLVEFDTPDGEEYDPIEFPDDGVVVLADDSDLNKCYLAVLSDEYGALKANTLYALTEVATVVEEADDLALDEEGDEVAEGDDQTPA